MTAWRALATGVHYDATGLAGVVGAVVFALG
jgi:hypothetical protein